MLRDLIRTLGLWRAQAGWLAAGIAVSAGSTLLGVALLALAGQGIAAALGGAALGGGLAFLLLRPLVALRPAARWSERMVTHAATFRALADTRIWFFRRLADRLPGGIGLGRSGDLLGRLVSDVDSLDGLYLRALVPVCSALAVVLAGAALLAGAPLLAAIVALPLAVALLLPLLLAPGAARAAAQAATAQGRLRAAAVDPLLGRRGRAGGQWRAGRRRHPGAGGRGAGPGAARPRLARRLGRGGGDAAGAGGAARRAGLGAGGRRGGRGAGGARAVPRGRPRRSRSACCRAPASRWPRAAAGARRLFELADAPPPVAEPIAPAAEPAGHAIRVEGLHFAWTPDRAAVFDGLDLDMPEGTRLALLGPSGIGKSSLVALLLKLAAPQAGRISFGGVDIADAAGRIRARGASPA